MRADFAPRERLGLGSIAFVGEAHRDAAILGMYEANWSGPEHDNQQWMEDVHGALDRYASGAYVNMADAGLTDWETAYFGAHRERLRTVKRVYDPDNFFHFAQSIPP